MLVHDRRYVAHIASGSLAFATLMSNIAGSPCVLEQLHRLSAQAFSLVFAANTALAMEDHPGRAGSASGLLGFTQFTLGSAVAPLVGLAGAPSALPMAISMPACSLAATVVFWSTLGRHR